MDLGGGPFEGSCGLVVGYDESCDMGLEFAERVERRSGAPCACQDRDPINLIQPSTWRRRKNGIARSDGISAEGDVLRLVGIRIKKIVALISRPSCWATTRFMKSRNWTRPGAAFVLAARRLASGDVESGEKHHRRADVIVRLARQAIDQGDFAVTWGPAPPAPGSMASSTARTRALGRLHVKADHRGRLGGERGIVALAPALTGGEINSVSARESARHIAPRRRRAPRRSTARSSAHMARGGDFAADRARTRCVGRRPRYIFNRHSRFRRGRQTDARRLRTTIDAVPSRTARPPGRWPVSPTNWADKSPIRARCRSRSQSCRARQHPQAGSAPGSM